MNRRNHILPDVILPNQADISLGKQAGLNVITLALMWGIASVGAGFVTASLVGISEGFLVVGLGLVVTAVFLFRSIRFERQSVEVVSQDNFETLAGLVALNRRAILLTDMDGRPLAGNAAYETLSGSRLCPLENIIDTDDMAAILAGMRFEAIESGISKRSAFGGDRNAVEIGIEATRSGHYFIWQVHRAGLEARMDSLLSAVSAMPYSLFQTLNLGLAIVDGDGGLKYMSTRLREWIGVGIDDELPQRLVFKNNKCCLCTLSGYEIEIDVIEEPIPHRSGEASIGRFLIIRNLDSEVNIPAASAGDILSDAILNGAPLAVFIVDEKSQITEFNDAAKRLAKGLDLRPNVRLDSILADVDEGSLSVALKIALKGRALRKPVDVTLRAAALRSGKVFMSSVQTASGQRVVLYIIENTQEKSLEQQFTQAQKMQAVGQLAGGVAHDFNNLLTAILGFCDLLLARYDTRDQSFADINQIKQNANRAANLVRQLLAFSRQQTLRPKILDVTDVIAELSNLLRRLIGENIRLNVVHGRDLKPVKVDQGQLEQVIINLAVNARDAMPHGGDLTISTRVIGSEDPIIENHDPVVPADYVLIEVRDTGTGIPEEHLAKIFEPFFTTKDVGKGTGLGLSTVYGILKQTGGYVFVESESGAGTCFQLLLLAQTDEAKAEADQNRLEQNPDAQQVADLSGKETILLVEDEDPVRLFASRALVHKGYTVVEAVSGEQALEKLRSGEHTFDLMISDVIMPNMDGPKLAGHARELFPTMPIIFISGYAEDVVRDNLASEDFYFLAKPFSLKRLAEQVKTVLGR